MSDNRDTDLTDPHGEAETLRRENERLRATNERLSDALYEAQTAPWPNWAEKIMLKLKGYGVDPGDEWDLAEQFDDWISQAISGECKSITDERDALRAEVEQTRAEGFASGWATAIEAAADYLEDDTDRLLGEYQREMRNAATAVRALPVDEEAAAVLDRIRMDARVRGMRTAAHICARAEQETKPGGPDAMIFHFGFTEGRKVCERAILARAAEIEEGRA